MEFTSIPLKGTEYLYTYHNSQQISGQTGLVGYLRADFGSSDYGFFNTWNEFRADYNTDEFKAEFYAVIDYFREKGRFLHKRRDMENFCYEVSNTFEYSNGREYGVRVDTEHYAFLMRLNPYKGEYNLYCYCYRKDWLDSHLERAKKGIRFIDSGYNDLFILPDGGTIQISYLNDKPEQRVCRYIDPYHVEIGNNLYHICEFAERMENIGATYKPV
ncbi:hypothetical protein [Lachnoclostridium sp. MSJ-17]|uniref:hypothetical protein n=1 Tax=Lachnoclostridium sp. MSJ-17 TaxID=2841516 RepID=UPI001C127783|nr:hypothetical protein [Lachnoclostridium sp. MSJ-17]MBU5463007.1 hypothetical protein [Lachnoclostridium sp. MSJ-17]